MLFHFVNKPLKTMYIYHLKTSEKFGGMNVLDMIATEGFLFTIRVILFVSLSLLSWFFFLKVYSDFY